MISFDQFWNGFKSDLTDLLKAELKLSVKATLNETSQIAEGLKSELSEWHSEISAGRATTEEFEWAIKAKLEATEIAVLTQLGLAKIKRDRIVNGIIKIALSNILKVPGL